MDLKKITDYYSIGFEQKNNLFHYQFEEILLIFFGSKRNDWFCKKDSTGEALKVVYNEGNITMMHGEDLTIEDVLALESQIAQVLEQENVTYFGRQVLFADCKIDGFYKYKDVFQLLPLPSDAPLPTRGITQGGYPILLEYKFEGVPERGLHTNNYFKQKRGRELSFLMCLITKIDYGQVNFGSQVWVTKFTEGQQQTSQYVHEGYLYNLKTDNEFTTVNLLTELPKIPTNKYFFEGNSFDDDFALPDIFDILCEKYFGLNQKQQQIFQRACYWFQISAKIFNVSLSASFSNLVTAIEALSNEIDLELAECKSCGNIEYRPTKQFKDFIEKHSVGLKRKQIDNFYTKRSDLSHGKLVFSFDLQGISALHSTFEDQDYWRELRSVARTVILNWLLTNN